MDNNELNRVADLILSKLNSIENENKSREEQLELIKPVLIELSFDQRKLGRTQVLNYMEDEMKKLRN